MAELRTGHGYDVHRLGAGRPLIVGGIRIPFERGLLGHSDADVLVHAVMDALLGAAGMKDIGHLFPPTDERFAAADSCLLLAEVAAHVRAAGYQRIVNVDATIIAQEPSMAPHIDGMRSRLAQVMGVEISRVGIKATTTEGLGFLGRGEAIAAHAVCLIASDG